MTSLMILTSQLDGEYNAVSLRVLTCTLVDVLALKVERECLGGCRVVKSPLSQQSLTKYTDSNTQSFLLMVGYLIPCTVHLHM